MYVGLCVYVCVFVCVCVCVCVCTRTCVPAHTGMQSCRDLAVFLIEVVLVLSETTPTTPTTPPLFLAAHRLGPHPSNPCPLQPVQSQNSPTRVGETISNCVRIYMPCVYTYICTCNSIYTFTLDTYTIALIFMPCIYMYIQCINFIGIHIYAYMYVYTCVYVHL